MNTQQQGLKAALLILLLLCFAIVQVFADPSGATISNPTTVNGPTQSPASRNDARGTITTVVLNSIQQDNHWKAYVGNVSGILSLQNPNNFTIYSWDLTTVTGQVYASRFNNITWPGMSCADSPLIVYEEGFNNMSAPAADNISRTFNWTVHKSYIVANTTLGQNTCPSTVTNINNTRQAPTVSSPFQELLIKDPNNQLVYMAEISDNVQGYDNTTYDFQMIVAESDRKGAPTPYYFYVELR